MSQEACNELLHQLHEMIGGDERKGERQIEEEREDGGELKEK